MLIKPFESQAAAQEQADRLIDGRYINRGTNAVFVDISVFNYMLETTAWVRMSAEFNSAGGVDCATDIQSYQLLWSPKRRAYKTTLTIAVALGCTTLRTPSPLKCGWLGYPCPLTATLVRSLACLLCWL